MRMLFFYHSEKGYRNNAYVHSLSYSIRGDYHMLTERSKRAIFRHARVSSTYPSKMSVRKSYFRISILSVSLVALREKLKIEDPNYFSILGLGKIS